MHSVLPTKAARRAPRVPSSRLRADEPSRARGRARHAYRLCLPSPDGDRLRRLGSLDGSQQPSRPSVRESYGIEKRRAFGEGVGFGFFMRRDRLPFRETRLPGD
jgi:hypothetical protein